MMRLIELVFVFGLVLLGVKYLYDHIEWKSSEKKQQKEDKQ